MPTYRILLTEEPEGGYTVLVPALPGCITYGDNINHANYTRADGINIISLASLGV
jgi:predicted RNase H-like HicB family nuclease